MAADDMPNLRPSRRDLLVGSAALVAVKPTVGALTTSGMREEVIRKL